jgi:xylan 1,4-beta-xylosidase
VLGRETAIQRVTWTDDGWPRIEGAVPHVTVDGPRLPPAPVPARPLTDDFAGPTLDPQWSTLRRPATGDWVSVHQGPDGHGRLRIAGGRAATARDGASLVARRIEHFRATFAATVDFAPVGFQQMAGIAAYYNSRNWYLLRVTVDEERTPFVDLLVCDRGRLTINGPGVPVSGPVRLRAELDHAELRFGLDGVADAPTWGPVDAAILSDEYAREFDGASSTWGFTGAFFGLWVHDYTGGALPAYFSAARYIPG